MMDAWMNLFKERVVETFGDQVRFIGLQGSRARGEARAESDIDVVVILEKVEAEELRLYRRMLEAMPERDKICGFLSGKEELENWEISELFQFCRDTIGVYGSLESLVCFDETDGARKAVHAGACMIYHSCVHNFLHDRSKELLLSLCKAAVFVIQAEYFLRRGRYVHKHRELFSLLEKREQEILEGGRLLREKGGPGAFEDLSELLLAWSSERIVKKIR